MWLQEQSDNQQTPVVTTVMKEQTKVAPLNTDGNRKADVLTKL